MNSFAGKMTTANEWYDCVAEWIKYFKIWHYDKDTSAKVANHFSF